MTHATVTVALTVISLLPDVVQAVGCTSCGELMNLHQPETGFPERMLWTCELCGTWFLMDLIPESSEAVLVCLPDGPYFRNVIGR